MDGRPEPALELDPWAGHEGEGIVGAEGTSNHSGVGVTGVLIGADRDPSKPSVFRANLIL